MANITSSLFINRVFDGALKYTIKDSGGTILYNNASIELVTQILEQGTALNKSTMDKIVNDLNTLNNDKVEISVYNEFVTNINNSLNLKANSNDVYTKSQSDAITNAKYSIDNIPPYPVTKVAGRTGDIALTKADVGLSNVDNVKQYSELNTPPYPVTKVNNKTGDVILAKTDIGLGDVDDTADIDKPVSTAQQEAIDNASGVDLKIKTVAEKQPPAYEIGKAVVEHINGDTITTYGKSKNLTSQYPENSVIFSDEYDYIEVKLEANITYVYSALISGTSILYVRTNIDTYTTFTDSTTRQFITFITDSTGIAKIFILKVGQLAVGIIATTLPQEMQVELGTVATPYEPYAPARRLIETEAGDLYTQYDNGGEWSAKKSAGSGKSGIVYENNFIIEPKWFKVASLPMFSGNTIYTCSLDVQILNSMIVDRIKDYGTLNIGIIASDRTISTTRSYMEFSSYGNTLIANNFIIAKDDIYLNIYIKIPTRYTKYVVHLNNEYNLSSYGDGMLTLYNNGIPEAVDPVAILTSTLRQY